MVAFNQIENFYSKNLISEWFNPEASELDPVQGGADSVCRVQPGQPGPPQVHKPFKPLH